MENTIFPGRDNYTGPDSGILGLCHHNRLFEHSHSFAKRVKAIRNTKPGIEITIRLHNLIYIDLSVVPGVPPEARAKWNKVFADWNKACADWDKAYQKWDTPDAEWDRAYAEGDRAYAELKEARTEWDRAYAYWDSAYQKR